MYPVMSNFDFQLLAFMVRSGCESCICFDVGYVFIAGAGDGMGGSLLSIAFDHETMQPAFHILWWPLWKALWRKARGK